jgi:hypothetical protein
MNLLVIDTVLKVVFIETREYKIIMLAEIAPKNSIGIVFFEKPDNKR